MQDQAHTHPRSTSIAQTPARRGPQSTAAHPHPGPVFSDQVVPSKRRIPRLTWHADLPYRRWAPKPEGVDNPHSQADERQRSSDEMIPLASRRDNQQKVQPANEKNRGRPVDKHCNTAIGCAHLSTAAPPAMRSRRSQARPWRVARQQRDHAAAVPSTTMPPPVGMVLGAGAPAPPHA
eukprot:6863476-Prymnesium_polylepis.1